MPHSRNSSSKNRPLGVLERDAARVIGFTTEMDEWMRAADLIVSKPGGLTTSEALAAGTVIVIINPIPGQETRNSDFLLESGAAVKFNAASLLTYKVTGLLRDPERLARLRAGVARIARPRRLRRRQQIAGVPACLARRASEELLNPMRSHIVSKTGTIPW